MTHAVTIENVTLIKDTGQAWLVQHEESDDAMWLPISVIEDTNIADVGDTGFIEIPRHWARKKGLE